MDAKLQSGGFARSELDQSVAGCFEKTAELYAGRVAVRDTDSVESTYLQLNLAANRIAHALRLRVPGSQKPIGLLVKDAQRSVSAILGVLKSANFYVPLEGAQPIERLSAILEDCRIRVLLTDKENLRRAEALAGTRREVICVDHLDPDISTENLQLPISPDDIAAVFYTSGSTGKPKGVIQNQRNVLHRAMVCTNAYGVRPDDRFFMLNSPAYSASLRPLFAALLNGAAVLPFNLMEKGQGRIGEWLIQERITIYYSVSSVFRRWVRTLGGHEDFRTLRLIDISGESATKADVELYKQHFSPACVLVNSFGSNETGTIRHYFVRKDTPVTEHIVPVGHAVEDKDVLILDEAGNPLGFNQSGEIAVRSAFLSPGYWMRPDLTSAAFRSDPECPDRTIYHTGDLGLILPDGCLLYQGRKNFTAKIHGVRVEPGEIESVLHLHPSIQEAVVVPHEQESGEQRLTAYLVLRKKAVLTPADVRKFVAEKLPAPMVPAVVLFCGALPRNANGKVDRQALPQFGEDDCSADDVAPPRDAFERTLRTMWEATLGVSPIGLQCNFFDLGGDSLATLQLIVSIEKAYGKDISPAVLFQSPTLEQLSAVLRQDQGTECWSSMVPVQPIGARPPFFWIHGDSSSAYLPRYLRPDQPLYLLTHQSEDGKPARYTEVESIAEYYLREIRKVQQTGPYFLGGYSFGCIVSLEIAQRLTRLNEEVGLLILLDPPSFNRETHHAVSKDPSARGFVRRHIRALAELTPKEQIQYVMPRIQESFSSWTTPLRKRWKKAACKLYPLLGRRLPVSLRSPYILNIYSQARARYVPRPYDGRTLLFRGEARSYRGPTDWDHLLTGEVEVHSVRGDHDRLRDKQEVQIWAVTLDEALTKAQSRCSPETPVAVLR